jgi:hypothetical protein
MIGFFNNFLGGTFVGFILSNLINFIELGMIMKMMKDVKEMLKEFRAEGKSDKWLK